MKNRIFLIFIISLVFLVSCKREPGDWEDNIRLSNKAIVFKAEGDSAVVTTVGTGWIITELVVGGEAYVDFENVALSSESYTIIRGDLMVVKRNRNTLFIKTAPNNSNRYRYFEIRVQSGDYYDKINLGQLAIIN